MNTPKRSKTAYYATTRSDSPLHQFQNCENFPSITADRCQPAWPWTASMECMNAVPVAAQLNGVSSPSSSCGSPEMTTTSGKCVLRTPSTTTTKEAMQFPTPTTTSSSCLLDSGMILSSGGREHKRGRPRSESLTNLMIEGSTSPSAIKCKFCNRVFPREKSLAAHLRTHTGEQKYTLYN